VVGFQSLSGGQCFVYRQAQGDSEFFRSQAERLEETSCILIWHDVFDNRYMICEEGIWG
jgi:hypothetical protein